MRSIAVKVQYDGHAYEGFQRQSGSPTIQGEIESAIEALQGVSTAVTGSGRTDAGVHAAGQVISFRTGSAIPPERWSVALNTKLPRDIRAVASCEAPEGFSARHDAVEKTYRYMILPGTREHAILRYYAWVTVDDPDVGIIRKACSELLGEHDFTSFRSAGSRMGSAVRTISRIEVREGVLEHLDLRVINLSFTANGFLYKMVRNMVGALMEPAAGRQPAQGYITGLLAAMDRKQAPAPAPASGLYLLSVRYPDGMLGFR